ncbi:DNA-formamidopyrimidine glycosylase [Priestia endophytica]|uniref:DNA-formamidopyrimidine glycosylase n=1 Tax=Priestia endophytica TaxID=135735 RepID=UPI002E1FDA79|nr:DNA-formamidopyrimidine glycosylase [Priestia endophytica]MED4070821.1 DNA-formamidopyrimidine glycosylase [Priestia endophytica]
MPELPEVETVRKTLVNLVSGKTITRVNVLWPNIIKRPVEVAQFTDALIKQKIHDVGRRGKFLLFYLDDYTLISHLRMEGKYRLVEQGEDLNKHDHVMMLFSDGTELRYNDVRKFGTLHLFKKGTEFDSGPLVGLGPEPFAEEFTTVSLQAGLAKTNRKVKVALLDQKIVVGLGNIYVDEALFRAGIHPERVSHTLGEEEIVRLHQEIIATLAEAVEKGGSTIRSYVNTQGEIGTFQHQHFVYGKKGEPCQNCGTEIEKFTVGGRGTHICPSCQPFPRI